MRAPSWHALRGLALSVCLGAVAAACGPVQYLGAIRDADDALGRAREAGAERRAPYDYWYASAHLEKAREEAFESSYQDAVRHARVAEEHATRALEASRPTNDEGVDATTPDVVSAGSADR